VTAIRVLIADDQALIRAGLASIVSSEPGIEVIGEAADGEEAVARAETLAPDVVLMDIRMPVCDGIEATRRLLAARAAGPRVLILTTFGDDEYVYAALRAGASGFLLKNAPPEQLIDAIRVLAAGEALLAPSITRRLIEAFARLGRSASPPTGLDELTPRELDVLSLLGRGLSNAEIAAALVVERSTVKTHVNRILTKLELRDRAQAVVAAYESGLVEPGGETRKR
jgi:DNA-binding NarL/FixJ family response regulator